MSDFPWQSSPPLPPNSSHVPLSTNDRLSNAHRSFLKFVSEEFERKFEEFQNSIGVQQSPSQLLMPSDWHRPHGLLHSPPATNSSHLNYNLKQRHLGDHSSSSGYHSGSSSSSLFTHSLRKAPSVESVFQSPNLATGLSPVKRAIMERPSRVRFMKESITRILDQVDARVAFLRETATELEEEKRKLAGVLNSIKSTDDLTYISEIDREDILVTTDRLTSRLNSVHVQVITPRTEDQSTALQAVNNFIDGLVDIFRSNKNHAKHICKVYLNTCSSDGNCGPIDDKFQAAIIACAADDQKKIKKRLEALLVTFNHAES